MVVAEASARFLGAARFDDELTLEVAITRLGNTSCITRHRVLRDGEMLVEGELRHVIVDRESLQKTPIPVTELVAKLQAISGNGYDERIFVRGDAEVDYGKVMQVMGVLNQAGFTRIGLVTDQVKQPNP